MLYEIDLSVRGQELKCESAKMASDTINEVRCHFSFDGSDWNGLDLIKAVFANNRMADCHEVIVANGSCVIPHEVLAEKGTVSVNLYGAIVDGDVVDTRITTYKTGCVDVLQKVNTDGSNTIVPTPGAFEQFVAIVKEDAEKAEQAAVDAEGYKDDAQESAESAQQSASNAAQSAEQASASKTNAETAATQAEASAENAAGSAESAGVAAGAAGGFAAAAQASAGSASASEANAQSAKTNAETAQGLAEDARDDAIEAKEKAENMLGEVIRYDEEEVSGTDIPINADQLNGHPDTYFAKQADFADLEEEVGQNTTERHNHDNKGILDVITQAMINAIGTIADKYVKPTGGIPKSDMSDDVKESLEKADNALQIYNIVYTEEE